MIIKDIVISKINDKAKLNKKHEFDSKNYFINLQDNIVPTINFELLKPDFQQGSGNELHEKMKAPYSSSMLATNTFGIFKEKIELFSYQTSKYNSMKFEAKCPTGLNGTPPNLDILFENEYKTLGIESKMTEYLTQKRVNFNDSYYNYEFVNAESIWLSQIEKYQNKKLYFDVAQIIKHYLGLTNTYRVKEIDLLYLFWEPLNWSDFDIFKQHRSEINEFKVFVSNSKVKFYYMSYNQFWQQWDKITDLEDHLIQLRNRYEIII